MSCTEKLPEVPRPGTWEKVNVLVAAAAPVLMMKTCTPFELFPEKYSGVEVTGAEGNGVNGAAGAPTVRSWWNASSSAFLMMASCVLFRRLSYRRIHQRETL